MLESCLVEYLEAHMLRQTCYFSGRVQGVGFRYTVQNLALQYNVRGYDKNLADGRVELVMEGPENEMKGLVASHPGLIRPVTLPKTSWQGRPIQGIELAKNVDAKDDGRAVYFVMGEHHAREWPSAEIAMEFADFLANGYGQDPQITSLLERERIVIVPIVNVDGFISSRDAFDLGDEFYANNVYITDPTHQVGDVDGGSEVTLGESVANGGNFAYRRKNCDGGVPSPDRTASRSLRY